jgi:ubiquinone/menaquinone biosynthesis C-methylase UbiE
MAAAYDTYDYPSYWEGREYEHKAEVVALKAMLSRIKAIDKLVEIGSGYGRLTPYYIFRAKRVILTDPSAKLLKMARREFSLNKVKFIQSKAENLIGKIRSRTVDMILVVRVLHHIEDVDKVFAVSKKLLKKNGYLLIEFPNKKHLKATISEFLHGNFTFPIDIFPKDLRSARSIKKNVLPFVNYHPDVIKEKLESHGFKIIEVRSVSNIRSSLLKKILPPEYLLSFEKSTQRLFAKLNIGPSIFILAKNTWILLLCPYISNS